MTVKLSNSQIEQISKLICEYVTGTEITTIFNVIKVDDTSGESTKWKRVYGTFIYRTNVDKSSNSFLRFITEILKPEKFVDNEGQFENIRNSMNKILAFCGLEYNQKGEFTIVQKATTISEAKKRVNNIVSKLRDKKVNSNVLKYCTEELLSENYFHAVFEAAKGLSDKIKEMTGLTGDGAALFDKVFSVEKPLLAINSLKTDAEQNQQKGFCMMLKGIFLMVRNVTAHTPKIKWIIDEDEAIKMLMTISYLQDILDDCCVVPSIGGESLC